MQMPLIAEVHVIIMTPLLSFVIEPIRSIGSARLPCQRDLVSNQRLQNVSVGHIIDHRLFWHCGPKDRHSNNKSFISIFNCSPLPFFQKRCYLLKLEIKNRILKNKIVVQKYLCWLSDNNILEDLLTIILCTYTEPKASLCGPCLRGY